MAVNTLVTGMIVFKILKVTRVIRPTSIEQTLGSTRGNDFRHIIFIIIESGMALFAIQVVRVVLVIIPVPAVEVPLFMPVQAFVIGINQMLGVIIIISVHFLPFFNFADNIYLDRGSHQR